jgi:hypothetical protein
MLPSNPGTRTPAAEMPLEPGRARLVSNICQEHNQRTSGEPCRDPGLERPTRLTRVARVARVGSMTH